jgi:hybrid polyketide synthase/nonribosomal peptide synthetase ACE1
LADIDRNPGTGTAAGDPIEAEAISRVLFGPDTQASRGTQPLYVGSIKTVLGHSEGTAGVAGVLKASLALQHGVIPPNLLLSELSPTVKPFCSHLQILQEARDWPAVPEGPRRASVNSFGFGGTNAHAILEQFMPATPERQGLYPTATPMSPFNFSAASEKSLQATLAAHAAFLRQNPEVNLRDLSWTLNTRKSTLSTRMSIAALTVEDLTKRLDHAAQESDFASHSRSAARVLGIFTGQGAQWASMGVQLLQRSAVAQSCFERLQGSLDTLPPSYTPDWKLGEELRKGPESSRIGEAAISQPLCTAVQIAMVDMLGAGKVEMKAVVGHSSGEIAAAYAAGYLSAESAIRIAYFRGLLVDQQVKNGSVGRMLAVGTTHQDARELCELPSLKGRLTVAAYNSPTSVTLSGDAEAIQDAQEIFEDEDKFARMLRVDKAYHSHHMRPCADPYVGVLKESNIQVQRPLDKCPSWISSVVVGPAADLDQISLGHSYWADNMVNPVRFSQAVEYAGGAYGPFDVVIEIGPHPALKGPTTDTLLAISGQEVAYIPTLTRGKDDTEAFANTLGSLWELLGDDAVDFGAFDRTMHDSQAAPPRLLQSLPSYRWDHDRQYWHETRYGRAFRTNGSMPHALLGTMCPDGTAHEVRFRNYLSPRQLPWLAHHRIQGQSVFPAAGYLTSVVEAVGRLYPEGHGLVELVDVHIGKAIVFPNNETLIETMLSLRILEDGPEGMEAVFALYSETTDKESTQMVENARGKVRVMRSSSGPSLPIPERTIGEFVEVDPEIFYRFVGEKGYGYEGAFRGLIDTRRRFNQATGCIAVPSYDGDANSLLIHPGILDCALQALLLAYSYPGDGRLRTLHVPTKIDLICIDVSAWGTSETQHKFPLPFYASIDPYHHTGKLVGDVDIHSADGDRTLVQLQGLHYASLGRLSPESDPKLFLERTWGPELPDQSDTDWNDAEYPAEKELAFVLERVAYFYIRKLSVCFPREERSGLLWHHLRLLDYADHCLAWVDSDTHPWATKEWSEDTEADIMAMAHK